MVPSTPPVGMAAPLSAAPQCPSPASIGIYANSRQIAEAIAQLPINAWPDHLDRQRIPETVRRCPHTGPDATNTEPASTTIDATNTNERELRLQY